MADQPEIVILHPRVFVLFASTWIASAARRAVSERGRFTAALSGGETARLVYAALAELKTPSTPAWERMEIYFADERAVPPDHEESNFRMACEALLSRVPVLGKNVHRIHAEEPDRDRAASDYASLLPDVLDLVLLGMGEDGHTASLFPGSPALREPTRKALAVSGTKPPLERITLTPPAIRSARNRLVLVSGRSKAAAVVQALEGPMDPDLLTVQLAQPATWIIDADAASRLTGK